MTMQACIAPDTQRLPDGYVGLLWNRRNENQHVKRSCKYDRWDAPNVEV
jgi:hypothetical protein